MILDVPTLTQAQADARARQMMACTHCAYKSTMSACRCTIRCDYDECLVGIASLRGLPGHIHDEVPFPRFQDAC